MTRKAKKENANIITKIVVILEIILVVSLVIFKEIDLPYDKNIYKEMRYFLILLVVVYISIFIHITIHEAGHYIFGRLTGYKFLSFRVKSFIFIKIDGKLKLKRTIVPGTAGQCIMRPPVYNENMPYLLYNLGGVICNFLVSMVFLILLLLIGYKPFVFAVLFIFFYIGMIHVIANGIPMQSSYISNDGHNIYQIKKDPYAHRSFWLMLYLHALIVQGTRIKDIPKELLTLPPDANLDYSINASIKIIDHAVVIDEHNFIKAKEISDYLLNNVKLTGLRKRILRLDSCFCSLILSHNELTKEEKEHMLDEELNRFLSKTKNEISTCRFMYAWYLLAENSENFAKKQLSLFERGAKRYPYKSEVESERELIKIIDDLYFNKTY